MKTHRFDEMTRLLATRTHWRGALLGGLAALVGLGARWERPGAAQDAATPDASPAATPGLLDILAGTPPALDDLNALARRT